MGETLLDRVAIQRRVDAAEAGAIVELPAGRVPGGLVIPRALTLRGAGAAKTIIDGGGRECAVSVDAADALVRLEGLTITGGKGEIGGGVSAANGARVEIVGCTLRANEAARGGAVALHDGEVRLERCTVEENRAATGGGLYAGEIGIAFATDTTFRRNRAARGAAIALEDGARATLEAVSFDGDRASEGGHALFLCGSTTRAPVLTLTRVRFEAGVPGAEAVANDARFPAAVRAESTVIPD